MTIYEETYGKYKEQNYPDRMAKAMAGAAYFKTHGKTVIEEMQEDATKNFDTANLDCSLVKEILGIAEFHPAESEKAVGYKIDWKGTFVPNSEGVVVVTGTRAGAPINILGPKPREVIWTEDTLKKMTETWRGGTAGRNHETFDEGKIIDAFYENGNAYIMVKPNESLLNDLSKCVGVSVEAILKTDASTNKTIDGRGTGITFIFEPKLPGCSPDEGCKAMGEKARSEKMAKETDNKTELEMATAALVETKKEFETAMAAKEETIKTLSGEIAVLKEFKDKAIAERRTGLIGSLKEYGVASEKLESADIPSLELMVEVAAASAKKAEENAVHDSGASGTKDESRGKPAS